MSDLDFELPDPKRLKASERMNSSESPIKQLSEDYDPIFALASANSEVEETKSESTQQVNIWPFVPEHYEYKTLYKFKNKNAYHLYTDLLTQKTLFCKEYRSEHMESNVGFIREVNFLLKLNHPNIIKIKDIVLRDDSIRVFYDHYSENLTKIPVGDKNIKRYIYQLVTAVQYLHSKNIIHLDICPENIVLTQDQKQIKLLDFDSSFMNHNFLSKHTNLNIFYKAPEIYQGIFGPESDTWSLACIIYYLYTRKNLFDDLGNGNSDRPEPAKYFSRLTGLKGLKKLKKKLKLVPDSNLRVLLSMMLRVNPMQRIGLKNVLSHNYFSWYKNRNVQQMGTGKSDLPVFQEPLVKIQRPITDHQDQIYNFIEDLGFTSVRKSKELVDILYTYTANAFEQFVLMKIKGMNLIAYICIQLVLEIITDDFGFRIEEYGYDTEIILKYRNFVLRSLEFKIV